MKQGFLQVYVETGLEARLEQFTALARLQLVSGHQKRGRRS